MFRSKVRSLSLAIGLGLAIASGLSAAVPASDSLLPDSTLAYVSIPNVPKLVEAWNATQLNQLLDDPSMQPFSEDLRKQIHDKWTKTHEDLGLSIDDVRGVASGELGFGLIRDAKGRLSLALLVDATENAAKAEELLTKVSKTLVEQGAKRSEKQLHGAKVAVYDIPARQDGTPARQVLYFHKDGLLGASDDLALLTDVLNRASGKTEGSLAAASAYQAVMQRAKGSDNANETHLRWFVEPFDLLDVIGAMPAAKSKAADADQRRKLLKTLKNQGFDAVKAVGGMVQLSQGNFEILHRTAVYAPPPYKLAMRMLVFPEAEDLTPPTWVPRDVATSTSFQWDMQNAFENVASLFDEVLGGEGAFEATLRDLANDPAGPGIDIRKDMIAHLGQRATVVTDYKLPITPTSQRIVLVASATDEAALAQAVKRSMETDPATIQRVFQGHIIWETMAGPAAPGVPVVNVAPAPGQQGGQAAAQPAPAAPQLPNSAVAVANGNLYISTHVDFLEKLLSQGEDCRPLAEDVDFLLIQAELNKFANERTCARTFVRTDEEYRPTFEMFKEGKLPESETILAQLINALFAPNKPGEHRPAQLDGSKLPDYDVVRRYLGPAGVIVTNEEDGWLIVGLTLRKPQ